MLGELVAGGAWLIFLCFFSCSSVFLSSMPIARLKRVCKLSDPECVNGYKKGKTDCVKERRGGEGQNKQVALDNFSSLFNEILYSASFAYYRLKLPQRQ
jgi:hypothetical protein